MCAYLLQIVCGRLFIQRGFQVVAERLASVRLLHLLFLLAASCGATACDAARKARDSALDVVVGFVPRTVDTHVGRMASQPIVEKANRLPQELHAKVTRLVSPLASVLPKTESGQGVELRFHLVAGAAPNAFAFPDGSIFFTTGLFRLAETPEEVLAVAGHEIAHVLARHSMQGLVTQLGLRLGTELLLGDLAGVAGIASLGGQFMALQFSRDNEREADALGVELLRRAELPVVGASLFFERMAQWEQKEQAQGQSAQGASLSFFSTHPPTAERVAWARELRDSRGARVRSFQAEDFAAIKKAADQG